MTGALNALRQDAVKLLREAGVYAVTAMESESRKRWDGPVSAVSVDRVTCAAGGFRDYLGLRENPDTGAKDELYGRGVEITLGLDVYAPRNGGESACLRAADSMAEALVCRGVGGLSVSEVETGEVSFSERDGLYRLPVKCRCKGWLVAVADGGGAFADFEVKGRRI